MRSMQQSARTLPVAVLVGVWAAVAVAADWPQWRGPSRMGISKESGWSSTWSGSGPKRLWKVNVGQGYSSVAVVKDRVYTMGNTNNVDTVWCLNANTGKVIWKYSYRCQGGNYAGTRATPVVDGSTVYTVSREGHVGAFNASTGKILWGKNVVQEVRAAIPQWGIAGSPLVYGNLLILNIGSSGVALDKRNGKVVWKSGRGPGGYASPVLFKSGRQTLVAIFSAKGLAAVNPSNGKRAWFFPWETQYDVNAADPIVSGGYIFISSDYNKGCALLNVSSGSPKVVWQNRNMRNHFNSCVLVNGYLYGNDQNTLKCMDFRTGQVRWSQRGFGKGGLIAAGGKLIGLTGRGELLVAKASPSSYAELSRAKVLGGECWTHPVLANGKIYCRNHDGELVCLDVKS